LSRLPPDAQAPGARKAAVARGPSFCHSGVGGNTQGSHAAGRRFVHCGSGGLKLA
jgi:hypothetical protein